MNKAELLNLIGTTAKKSKDIDVSKATAIAVAELTFDIMKNTLKDVKTISIRNFGSFNVIYSAPRTAKNPRTGETIDVPAKNKVKFKPSAELASSVNE